MTCRDEREYRAQFTPEEIQEGIKKMKEQLRKMRAKEVKSNSIKVRIYPNRAYKQD